MKNPSDITGNRNCVFPACSTLPQPTVPLKTSTPHIFVTPPLTEERHLRYLRIASKCSMHVFLIAHFINFYCCFHFS